MNFKFCLISAFILSLSGCQKEQFERADNSPEMSNVEVRFGSKITTRMTNETWETDDHIGIFMVKTGEPLSSESVVNNASNMKYTFSSGSAFEPDTENDRMYYPSKQAVDFIAYYPYRAVTDNQLSFDITRQQNPSSIDLLYSDNLKNISATEEAQVLNFKHKLSKLVFSISPGKDLTEEDLEGLSLVIRDVPTSATFNLADAQITTDEESKKDITALVDGNTAQAIVYPGDCGNKEIAVMLLSGEFTFKISAESTWLSGYQYKYALTLDKNINSASIEATISPWEDSGESESLEGSDSEVTVIPWDGQSSDTNWYNSGETTFSLSTPSQLNGLSELVKSGITFEGKTIELVRDINLNNNPFPAIGDETANFFKGTFNGNSHTISGYTPLREAGSKYASLFTVNEGIISNVIISGVISVDNTADFSIIAGGIAGQNKGTIDGCRSYVKMNVTSTLSISKESYIYVGGIVGANLNVISNCQNYGSIQAEHSNTNEADTYMGGIAGVMINGKIESCENNQNLTASGDYVMAGGICGACDDQNVAVSEVESGIVSCSNYGDITVEEAKTRAYAAGIIGNIYDLLKITSCTNKGNVSSSTSSATANAFAGGVVARGGECKIYGSYNSGKIKVANSGKASSAYGGGIIGYMSANSEVHTSTHAIEALVESTGSCAGIAGYEDYTVDTHYVYGCCSNLGSPQKWIGNAEGSSYKAGVTLTEHTDD